MSVIPGRDRPIQWAHLVVYQPPVPASGDTPGTNGEPAEPVPLNLLKLTPETSA